MFQALPQELAVYYQLAGDTLRVARLLEIDKRVELHRATIVEGRGMAQQPAAVSLVPKDSLEIVKTKLRARYPWRPYADDSAQTLFVQVEPRPEHRAETLLNMMAIFRERGTLEDAIAEALERQQLGQWAASDLGPGGMNMLYDVPTIAAALPVVVRTLESHQVQHRARVARRIMTRANDWRYEVVYPIGFAGKFYSM